jgi:predicted lipoprotein with Yx(FWY)xxD motif
LRVVQTAGGRARRDPGCDRLDSGGLVMRKAFARAALLAALAVAAAACGGNDDEPSGTAAPAAPTTTAAQAAGSATVAVASSRLGDILVDADGRTLYVFTKDKGDQSACSGECAANWPALTGTATAGTGAQAALLSTATQADGSSQVTYGGKPLYYFAGDAKPGDTNGQGVGSVWYAVTADGEMVKAKATGAGYP